MKRSPLNRKSSLKRTGFSRKRSKKMEQIYVERRKLVEKMLAEKPYCQACPVFAKHDGLSSYIRHGSVDVHELVRRSQGGSILDESNCITVCRPCHRRIGENPELAYFLGLAKRSWEK